MSIEDFKKQYGTRGASIIIDSASVFLSSLELSNPKQIEYKNKLVSSLCTLATNLEDALKKQEGSALCSFLIALVSVFLLAYLYVSSSFSLLSSVIPQF